MIWLYIPNENKLDEFICLDHVVQISSGVGNVYFECVNMVSTDSYAIPFDRFAKARVVTTEEMIGMLLSRAKAANVEPS